MPAFITTFILPLLLYSFSAATTASGYADSDELITMGHLFGVAHPSGYPMAVTLTGIFMRLLFFLPPAHAANLLAALVQAGFVYLLYRVFKLIILLLPTRPSSPLFSSPTLDFLAQALALLTGVSSLFWLYGSVIEVVSFTNLLTISVIFSALSWYRLTLAGRHHSPSFYATWVLTGLGLAHIHTFVLLLPGLLILLIFGFKHLPSATLRFPRIILYGLSAAAVSFLIPNLIMFFFNLSQPAASWYFPSTLSGISNFILRQDYTGLFLEEDITRRAYIDIINRRFLTSQPHYFNFLVQHLTLPLVLLSVIGAFFALKHKFPFALALLVLFIVSGPIFVGVIGIPDPANPAADTFLKIGILQRQLLISEITVSILSLIGLIYLLGWISNFKFTLQPFYRLFIPFFFIFLLIYHTSSNLAVGYQADNHLISTYAHTMLEGAAPDSLIICAGDTSCFALLYASLVEQIRPDVTVLTKNHLYRRHFLASHPQYYPYQYHENPDYYASLIAYNSYLRPTYITLPDSFYTDYLGLDGSLFFLKPGPLLFLITPTSDTSPAGSDTLPIFHDLMQSGYSDIDYFKKGLKYYFSGLYNLQGLLANQWASSASAQIDLERALSLHPENGLPLDWLNLLSQGLLPNLPEASPSTYEALISSASATLETGDLPTAYDAARQAGYLRPTQPDPHFLLSRIFELGGYSQRSLLELQHAQIFSQL